MNSDHLRAALLDGDLPRPRLTWYDDERGERIDLSGKTLANWVAKAANWLESEMALEPGDRLEIDIPPDHWRAIYWSLAAWTRGLTVTEDDDADAKVACDGSVAASGADLVEPVAALAASPLQAMPDVMPPPIGPVDGSAEAVSGPVPLRYDDLTSDAPTGSRVLLDSTPPSSTSAVVAGLIGAGCSVVIVRGTDAAGRSSRSAAEAVDLVV